MLLRSLRPVTLALLIAVTSLYAPAQSLKVNDPTHLTAGTNRGTVDSFVGDQFWDFYALPGHFKLVFSGSSPQEGFSVGGRVNAGVAFVPKTPGATFTQHTAANGSIVFSGTVAQRTRVGVVVEKPNSPLVRQTVGYTLAASGSVDLGKSSGPADALSVVGTYAMSGGWVGNYGVVKLSPNGNILTSNGQTGHWELFDAESHVYTFTLPQDHRSLIFQPGRGFIDAQNNNLALEVRR
jgi:hypothetical protein